MTATETESETEPETQAEPPAEPVRVLLTPHEGRDVIRSRLTIPALGGGLNEAMDVKPVEIAIQEEVWVAVKLTCVDHHFPLVKGTDVLSRDHVMKPVPGKLAIVDGNMAQALEAYVDSAAERVRQERERRAVGGTMAMFDAAGEPVANGDGTSEDGAGDPDKVDNRDGSADEW